MGPGSGVSRGRGQTDSVGVRKQMRMSNVREGLY